MSQLQQEIFQLLHKLDYRLVDFNLESDVSYVCATDLFTDTLTDIKYTIDMMVANGNYMHDLCRSVFRKAKSSTGAPIDLSLDDFFYRVTDLDGNFKDYTFADAGFDGREVDNGLFLFFINQLHFLTNEEFDERKARVERVKVNQNIADRTRTFLEEVATDKVQKPVEEFFGGRMYTHVSHELRDELATALDLRYLYQHALSKLDKTEEALASIVTDICVLPQVQRAKLFDILMNSYLQFAKCVGAGTDVEYTKDELESFKPYYKAPNEHVARAMSKPANQNSPYKVVSGADVEGPKPTHPLANTIQGPDGTGMVVVLKDHVLPVMHSNGVNYRLAAEIDMADHLVRKIGELNMGAEHGQNVRRACMFLPHTADEINPIWTRATTKIVYDKRSTALAKQLEGVTAYTYRSGSKSGESALDNLEGIVAAKLSTIPGCALGTDKSSVWAVMNACDEGRHLLGKFQEKLTARYKPFAVHEYDNFFKVADYAVGKTSVDQTVVWENVNTPIAEFISNMGKSVPLLKRYNETVFEPQVLKFVAVNQALRSVISDELSRGWIVQMAPVCTLIQQLDESELVNPAYHVLNCHDFINKLGVDIVGTDFSNGQLMDGKFKPAADRSGMPSIHATYSYTASDSKSRFSPIAREMGTLSLRSDRANVLIDLTVNGRLYSPQNDKEYQAGFKFRGQQLLVGDMDAPGPYTAEYLTQFDGFVIHTTHKFFYAPNRIALAAFYSKFHLTVHPSTMTDAWGFYLVGIKQSEAELSLRPPPVLSATESKIITLVKTAVTMNILKLQAAVAGFGGYHPNPNVLYRANNACYERWPAALALFRIVPNAAGARTAIGTLRSYVDLVEILEQKKATVDIVKVAGVGGYFSQAMKADYGDVDSSYNADVKELMELDVQLTTSNVAAVPAEPQVTTTTTSVI